MTLLLLSAQFVSTILAEQVAVLFQTVSRVGACMGASFVRAWRVLTYLHALCDALVPLTAFGSAAPCLCRLS